MFIHVCMCVHACVFEGWVVCMWRYICVEGGGVGIHVCVFGLAGGIFVYFCMWRGICVYLSVVTEYLKTVINSYIM